MNQIANHWWMFLARGVTSFALAMLLAVGPDWSSMTVLTTAFGAWALIDGAGSIAFVLGARGVGVAPFIARGVLGIAIGALAIALRSPATPVFYLVIVAWALATGALEMAFGTRAWSILPRALGFMLVGAQALAFGVSLVAFPLESVVTLRGFLIAFAAVNGVAALMMGAKLHAPEPLAARSSSHAT